jgi:low temperature requirement protein LtrA
VPVLETLREFRRWFWKPPRAHGDILTDRRVSNLELLYDLVYVAVISQVAAALAADLSMRGLIAFVVVFGLIWIGWVNGSLYLELHGQEDCRTRSYVFLQMGILALVAVFAREAATTSGAQFALAYAAFLAVIAWLFFAVTRVDVGDTRRVSTRYAVILFASAVVIAISAWLAADQREIVWAGFGLLFIVITLILGFRTRSFTIGVTPTDSLVERINVFTIIVLGEVVVGVVGGLSHASADLMAVATGMLALFVGLGFWWIYFDIVGGRKPNTDGRSLTIWLLAHLPLVASIAAAGAASLNLIEHATDPAAPQAPAWLLAISTAIVLLSTIVAAYSLADYKRMPAVFRTLSLALAGAAVLAVLAGLLQPPPWLLAVVLGATLLLTWLVAVFKFMKLSAWPPSRASSETAHEEASAELSG